MLAKKTPTFLPSLQRPRSLCSHSYTHTSITQKPHIYTHMSHKWRCAHTPNGRDEHADALRNSCMPHVRRPPICPRTLSLRQFPPSAANPSLPFQTLQHTRQLNASHFLFTFDLPLSPRKPEKKEGKGGGSQTEGGERGGREEKWGAGELLLLYSPYLLSLSLLPFSPSVS